MQQGKGKSKGKVRPMTGRRIQQRCSLALDLDGWSMTSPPAALPPETDLIPIEQEAGCAPEPPEQLLKTRNLSPRN